MAPKHSSATSYPLRWETTGDTWCYASPIDCAAANGQYDLVRELLRLDSDLLLSLTSLRRLRLLDSIWDAADAAESRAAVARRLFRDCEISADDKKSNHLIDAGCGAWLLYAAAAGGDLELVNELLDLRPLLVFGEGEYGLTDMLYAAARSQIAEVFWSLYDFAVSPRFGSEDDAAPAGEVNPGYRKEVENRAAHAAARGGNVAVLTKLLGGDGVLGYRDSHGSTVLHAAAASGQIEAVKYLITAYDDIISSTDNEGNTALHVAAYKGQLAVVELLLTASPTSVSETNDAGNTLLHMAVAGAMSPGFQRLDRHIELVKQLTETPNDFRVEEVINAKNNEGRTALHIAIIGNVHSGLVQRLLTARYLHVNVRDDHGMTPLDYLKEQPQSSSSDMLIRQLISVGGMSYCKDNSGRNDIGSDKKMQDFQCSSPGTTFRLLDSEILKSLGIERMFSDSSIDHREVISRLFPSLSEMSVSGSYRGEEDSLSGLEIKKRGGRLSNTAKRLKSMFRWLSMKKKRMDDDDDGSFAQSLSRRSSFNESPVSLREMHLRSTSMPTSKRTLSVRSGVSSPSNRKRFASGVVQGALVDRPHGNSPLAGLSSSSHTKTSNSSSSSVDTEKGSDEAPRLMHKQGSSKSLMNQLLRFGGSSLSMKSRIGRVETIACH